jgi:hypothetical protein
MTLIHRFFNFDIESYIVFKEIINDVDENILLNEGDLWTKEFRLIHVNVNNREESHKLIALWRKAYITCPSIIDAERAVNRMYENGSLCFVAVREDTYVGMLWLGDNSNFMFSRIGSFLTQEINKSVYHHIYVIPEARGNNLQGGLRLLALSLACKLGIDNMYAFVGCKNFSSIKNFLEFSSCYRLIYHVAIDIGPLKFDFHPKLSIEKWISLKSAD